MLFDFVFLINLFKEPTAIVLATSMLPIFELRIGIPLGLCLGLGLWKSFIIAFIGNVLAGILWFFALKYFFGYLENLKVFKKYIKWKEKTAEQLEGKGYFALFIFVAIPLPGTGAYTGLLLARLLGLNEKKSLLANILGIFGAGIIVSVLAFFGLIATKIC
jgi:uncharacterized membrane protein